MAGVANGRWHVARWRRNGRWQMAGGHLSGILQAIFITLTIETDNSGFALGGSVATMGIYRAPLVGYSGYCSVPYRASGNLRTTIKIQCTLDYYAV
jgi:hypothetical protein